MLQMCITSDKERSSRMMITMITKMCNETRMVILASKTTATITKATIVMMTAMTIAITIIMIKIIN